MRSGRNKQITALLAKQGIATLALNLPGHGRPGEQSVGMLETFTVSQGLAAVKAAVDWIKATRRNVDTGKLAIVGVSVGGSVAFRALAETDFFASGVLISTRTTFVDARNGLYSWGDKPHRRVNSVLMRDGRRIKRDLLAPQISVPTLWLHGSNDSVVDPSHSTDTAALVTDAETYLILGGDHGMRDKVTEVAGLTTEYLTRKLLKK